MQKKLKFCNLYQYSKVYYMDLKCINIIVQYYNEKLQ